MDYNKYPIIEDKNSFTFRFFSEGPNGKIEKVVAYEEMGTPGIYNLGFGVEENTGEIDDLARTNNGDVKKILVTVASTIFIFTERFPGAMIYAVGSTKARNRLYRMSISNNYEKIQTFFEILGFKDGGWHPFQKNIEFEAFLAKRKILNL